LTAAQERILFLMSCLAKSKPELVGENEMTYSENDAVNGVIE